MSYGKYALFLMPSGKIYEELAGIINNLSKKYSSTSFPPHVTLYGSFAGEEKDIIRKTAKIASSIKSYEIQLAKVDYLDEYFRCLFVRVKETKEVMAANTKARGIFGIPDNKYMPHLSLLYGNFDKKVKEKIISEIGQEFNLKFIVKSIHLFRITKEIEKWHRIKEFVLG